MESYRSPLIFSPARKLSWLTETPGLPLKAGLPPPQMALGAPLPLALVITTSPGQERWHLRLSILLCLRHKLTGQRKRGPQQWRKQWLEYMWAGFGRPFVGTENAVIAENMCIEEFGICKMLRFLLDFFFFFPTRGQLGFQCMLVVGWG